MNQEIFHELNTSLAIINPILSKLMKEKKCSDIMHELNLINSAMIRLNKLASILPRESIEGSRESKVIYLIDDDDLIRCAWEMCAEMENRTLKTFKCITDFNLELINNTVEIDSDIYIDSKLNGTVKGEEYAKELFNRGYRRLYLTTGYESTDYKDMYWLKKVVDKEPPF